MNEQVALAISIIIAIVGMSCAFFWMKGQTPLGVFSREMAVMLSAVFGWMYLADQISIGLGINRTLAAFIAVMPFVALRFALRRYMPNMHTKLFPGDARLHQKVSSQNR